MDPSAQNTQNQTPNQPMRAQQPMSTIPTAPVMPANPVGSASKEAGPVQTAAAVEVPVSPEVSKPVEQPVELAPTVPEVAVEKSLEQVVEKSPDADKPNLSDAVKAAGVTFSGPGIPVNENSFGVSKLPMTYEQAAAEEKLHPKLNDSKRWLADLVMYVWRKIDPTIGKKEQKN